MSGGIESEREKTARRWDGRGQQSGGRERTTKSDMRARVVNSQIIQPIKYTGLTALLPYNKLTD